MMHLFHKWRLVDFLEATVTRHDLYYYPDTYEENLVAVEGYECCVCLKRKVIYNNLNTAVPVKKSPKAFNWAIKFMKGEVKK